MVIDTVRDELTHILMDSSRRFEINDRSQYDFLEIRHDGNDVGFPNTNQTPNSKENLLVSRSRDVPIPSLFLPDISVYGFVELLRDYHLALARESFQIFGKSLYPKDILDKEMNGSYVEIMGRIPGVFNYMMNLIRRRKGMGDIDCRNSRIVEQNVSGLGHEPNLEQLFQGTDRWYDFLERVEYIVFQTPENIVSDRGKVAGINLNNVVGIEYVFEYVDDEVAGRIKKLSEKLMSGFEIKDVRRVG